MKMIIIILTTISLFTSCKKESGPTIFEGKVVYADDGKPFVENATISIDGIKYNKVGVVPSATTLVEKESNLKNTGLFTLEFEENSEIDFFSLDIFLYKDTILNNIKTKILIDKLNSRELDCTPFDCGDDFKSGKAYRDMVIRVSK